MTLRFITPEVLALAAILLPALWFILRRGASLRARGAAQFGAQSSIVPRRTGRSIKLLLAVFSIIAALSRPYLQFDESSLRTKTDIVFVLDVSRSMYTRDVAGNVSRLERAKRLITDLVHEVPYNRIALVTFAGVGSVDCELTRNPDYFQAMLQQAGPSSVALGGTRIDSGIETAIDNVFDKVPGVDRQLVLVTDGGHHDVEPGRRYEKDEGWRLADDSARKARRMGIKLVAIGIGGSAFVPVPTSLSDLQPVQYHGEEVHTRLNEPSLQEVASSGSGEYFVGNDDSVIALFPRLAASLPPQLQFTFLLAFIAFLLLLTLDGFKFRHPKKLLPLAVAAMTLLHGAVDNEEWEGVARSGFEAFLAERYTTAATQYQYAMLRSIYKPELVYNFALALAHTGPVDEALKQATVAATVAEPGTDLERRANLAVANAFYSAAEDKPCGKAKALVESAVKQYKAIIADRKSSPDLIDEAKHNLQVAQKMLGLIATNPEMLCENRAPAKPAVNAQPPPDSQNQQAKPTKGKAAIRNRDIQDW